MTMIGWAQIALVLGLAVLLAWPAGAWLAGIAQGAGRTARQRSGVEPGAGPAAVNHLTRYTFAE